MWQVLPRLQLETKHAEVLSLLISKMKPVADDLHEANARFTKIQMAAMLKMASTPKDKELIRAASISGLSNTKVRVAPPFVVVNNVRMGCCTVSTWCD